MKRDKDQLRKEYSEELIKSGVRGKHAKRFREGTNLVLIEPDLHKIFPDSDAVNRALRDYLAQGH
ncbi:MAG TPA: hypothetical protein VI566_00240 [Xanthomonadales bacterium]|nr:hypothetical protein [Xanthomonadales bacterium]